MPAQGSDSSECCTQERAGGGCAPGGGLRTAWPAAPLLVQRKRLALRLGRGHSAPPRGTNPHRAAQGKRLGLRLVMNHVLWGVGIGIVLSLSKIGWKWLDPGAPPLLVVQLWWLPWAAAAGRRGGGEGRRVPSAASLGLCEAPAAPALAPVLGAWPPASRPQAARPPRRPLPSPRPRRHRALQAQLLVRSGGRLHLPPSRVLCALHRASGLLRHGCGPRPGHLQMEGSAAAPVCSSWCCCPAAQVAPRLAGAARLVRSLMRHHLRASCAGIDPAGMWMVRPNPIACGWLKAAAYMLVKLVLVRSQCCTAGCTDFGMCTRLSCFSRYGIAAACCHAVPPAADSAWCQPMRSRCLLYLG